VAASPPDGYTLLVGASGALSIIPAISVKPPYDTLKAFAPVSMDSHSEAMRHLLELGLSAPKRPGPKK
jgi:tripartite-type tricarboxylate transporter receptor subunit TctC